MKSNHVFQSAREHVQLSPIQSQLLEQTKHQGMTATHLLNWQPCSIHPELASSSFNLETASLEATHKLFSVAHSEAILFLMRSQTMQPLVAISEINELTAHEATLLVRYYHHHFNRDFILNFRDSFDFNSHQFEETMNFLHHHKKISFTAALEQMRDLAEDELVILQDLYRYGVHGEHLRQAKLGHASQLYVSFRNNTNKADSTNRDAASYFVTVFRYGIKNHKPVVQALQEAASELMLIKANVQGHFKSDTQKGVAGISSKKINFLSFYAYSGVRAADCPTVFNKEYRKTMMCLRWVHGFDVPRAIAEMKGLSDDKLLFIRKYFGQGVNHRNLHDFPHNTVFLRSFMKTLHWDPVEAINNLAPLTSNQLVYFYYLQPYGMTLQMTQALTPDSAYSHMRKDVAIFLINEREVNPVDALQTVTTQSEEALSALMRHDASVFVPVMK